MNKKNKNVSIILVIFMKGSDFINNKRAKLFYLGIFFFILMTISGVYAVITPGVSGALSTSAVDIEVKNYTLNDNNEEIEYDNNNTIIPGNEMTFIPKIFNKGVNCYLRIKVNYINDNINFEDYVTNFSDKFKKYGDYYYYDGVFSSNDNIKVFDTIKIPNNAESLSTNKTLKIEVIAEAVQEDNFVPDYNMTENPWKGIVPTKNISNSANMNIDENAKVNIKYENNTENDISVPDSFLENTKRLLPGDNFVENIVINNNDKDNAKYYLKIDVNENDEDTKKLLSQINLEITNEKGELFKGKFFNNGKILIGALNINEKENLKFKISVPPELSNEYSNIVPDFSIRFLAEYDEKNGGGLNNDSNSNNAVPNIINIFKNPKTGDKIDIVLLIFLLSSIGLVITIILDYRERKKL